MRTQHQFVAKASFHPQVEQLNRDFTGLVSIGVTPVAVLGSLVLVPRRRDLIGWSLGLVGGLVAEIILGGIVVLSHLWPPFVMAHFLLGLALVWNAVVLHHRSGHPDTPGTLTVVPAGRPLGRALVVLAGVVLVTRHHRDRQRSPRWRRARQAAALPGGGRWPASTARRCGSSWP